MLPLDNAPLAHVDESIVDFTTRRNHDHIGNASWPWSLGRLLQPGRHLGLARLVDGDDIVEDIAVRLLDCRDGRLDLGPSERIKGMGEVFWHNGAHREVREVSWTGFMKASSDTASCLDKASVQEKGYSCYL